MKRERNAKQAFIEGTIRVVARDGLDKTTTKAIATEAGLSEAYIYRCYDSKDFLLQATFHMEDVCLAEHVRKSLSVMRIRGLNWKERCFLLWKSCWEFILHKPDDCRFYLQYYYSASCRRHAYDEHLKYFHSLFNEIRPVFRPDTNVDMLLHQIFDTMLSFAARVLSGEIKDSEDTTKWTFEQVYSFVRPNAREDLVETARTKERDTVYIALPRIQERWTYLLVKRLFDSFFALIGLIVLAIPMAIIALLIVLDSPGGAIFKQERLGKNGKPFLIYKFRTMNHDAEVNGPKWADKEDKRCTRFGAFLRKTRLDELPQFWNILKGDMSFVGPRPERQYFYEQFEKYIIGFSNRLVVTPGLTGYAQVNGGYELEPEEKIVYDMEYIEKRSVLMDIKCLVKTVSLIFTHEGAR